MPEMDSRKDAAALPKVGFETQFKDFCSPPSESQFREQHPHPCPRQLFQPFQWLFFSAEINIKIGMGQKKAEAGDV